MNMNYCNGCSKIFMMSYFSKYYLYYLFSMQITPLKTSVYQIMYICHPDVYSLTWAVMSMLSMWQIYLSKQHFKSMSSFSDSIWTLKPNKLPVNKLTQNLWVSGFYSYFENISVSDHVYLSSWCILFDLSCYVYVKHVADLFVQTTL